MYHRQRIDALDSVYRVTLSVVRKTPLIATKAFPIDAYLTFETSGLHP
jgi:hypothetical protein